MTSIQNTNIPRNNSITIVENMPKNVRKINFKADSNDSFVRQKTQPVYTQPPMLDQQAIMRKAIEDQKKAQKNQKIKNNVVTGLSVALTAAMLIYFGSLLRSQAIQRKGQKAASQALQGSGENIIEMINNCPNKKIQRIMAEEASSDFGVSKKKIRALNTLAHIDDSKPKKVDIDEARRILNEEVIGMDEAKEQILKHLEFRNCCIDDGIELDTPFVLALDGPAGTAKTTLANAVAKACGMPHKELSMAGMTGKAPIKGSEKVYSGATWGEIADAQIEHKTRSIVYTFDEIEKTGTSEHHGKAEDALLSLMDNRHYVHDDFLELDIDVKDSIIITTSNEYEKLSEPMKSRLSKVIRIKPYTDKIKKEVAEFKIKHFMKKYKMSEKCVIKEDALNELVKRHEGHKGGREISNEVKDLMENIYIYPEYRSATKEKPFEITKDVINKFLILE